MILKFLCINFLLYILDVCALRFYFHFALYRGVGKNFAGVVLPWMSKIHPENYGAENPQECSGASLVWIQKSPLTLLYNYHLISHRFVKECFYELFERLQNIRHPSNGLNTIPLNCWVSKKSSLLMEGSMKTRSLISKIETVFNLQ